MQIEDTLSTTEVASLLGGTRQWIHKLIKRGELKAQKVGRDWRVDRASVMKWIKKNQED